MSSTPIAQSIHRWESGSVSLRAARSTSRTGLNWKQILDAGGLALGDEIEIHLGIEATKAS
jgi:hypothetical protein